MHVFSVAMLALTLSLGSNPNLSPEITRKISPEQTVVINSEFSQNTQNWRVGQGNKKWLATHGAKKGILKLKATNKKAIVVYKTSPQEKLTNNKLTLSGKALNTKVGLRIIVKEVKNNRVLKQRTFLFGLQSHRWSNFSRTFGSISPGSHLLVRVNTGKLKPSQAVVLDYIRLRGVKEPAQPPPNSCTITTRGVPTCGAYVGGAYKGNADLGPWENEAGAKMAIHRTFWRSDQVNSAVDASKKDLAVGRLPWISFKLPYDWDAMADGRGDTWAENLALEIAKLDGPVWIAFHHEPENDEGNLKSWTRMQARLGPILRTNAPNASFTVILMGYHQLPTSPDPNLKLDALMPNTKIDVLGMDPYNHYSPSKKVHTDFKPYFETFNNYAKNHSMEWAIAETGLGPDASASKPTWINDVFKLMREYDGIALSYFNSNLNSSLNYEIDTAAEHGDFRNALQASIYLR